MQFCNFFLQDDYDSDCSHAYSQRYLNRHHFPRFSEMPGEMSVVRQSRLLMCNV